MYSIELCLVLQYLVVHVLAVDCFGAEVVQYWHKHIWVSVNEDLQNVPHAGREGGRESKWRQRRREKERDGGGRRAGGGGRRAGGGGRG